MKVSGTSLVLLLLLLFSHALWAETGVRSGPEDVPVTDASHPMLCGPVKPLGDDSEPMRECVKEWLGKAMTILESQIKDPKKVTKSSQAEVMRHLKRAYECIEP